MGFSQKQQFFKAKQICKIPAALEKSRGNARHPIVNNKKEYTISKAQEFRNQLNKE